MKRPLLALLLTASPLIAMLPNDVKKTVIINATKVQQNTKKTSCRCIQDFLKSVPRLVTYQYSLNNRAAMGQTSRIYCPSINHKILAPCKETFALILPVGTWAYIVRQPQLVEVIACGFFSEPP